MKKNSHLYIFFFIIFFCSYITEKNQSIELFGAISPNESSNNNNPSIAYLYYNLDISALNFDTLLTSWGYNVDLFDITNTLVGMLEDYDLIIVDQNTGNGYSWYSPEHFIVRDFNKPIIGIAGGGSCLFQQIGASMNWGNSMSASGNNFTMYNPEHSVFINTHNIPNPIIGSISSLNWLGMYIPYLDESVEPLLVCNNNLNYSILSIEDNRYCFWGIKNALSDWSSDLVNLFSNTLYYLLHEIPVINKFPQVAYIYNSDISTATDYQNMIGKWDYSVSLITIANLEYKDLSIFDLFILSTDSGASYNWNAPDFVEIIDNYQKPILGIKDGGSSFFDDIYLNGSYGMSMFYSGQNLIINQPSHPIFNYPYHLDDPIIAGSSPLSCMGLYKPRLDDSVIIYASGQNQPNYTILSIEDGQYGFWGIGNTPEDWEIDIEHLFENFMNYLLSIEIPKRTQVAYICNNEPSFAIEYEKILEMKEYRVSKININEISIQNWSKYQLIILGTDTGSNYLWESSSEADFLNNLNVPIIGIARGGSCFYSELNLNASWGMTMISTGNNITIISSTHPLFHQNYSFKSEFRVSDSNLGWVGMYIPRLADYVQKLMVDSQNLNYSLLTIEENKYLYWGYSTSPNLWNLNLKNLFHSSVLYMLKLFELENDDNSNITTTKTDSSTNSNSNSTSESDGTTKKISGYSIFVFAISGIAMIALNLITNKKRIKKF